MSAVVMEAWHLNVLMKDRRHKARAHWEIMLSEPNRGFSSLFRRWLEKHEREETNNHKARRK